MKTIETKMRFCKSVSRWAPLWLLAFGIFPAAPACLVPTALAQSTYEPYTFTTLAGNAGYGSADGAGSAARFDRPSALAIDSAGNLYVADTGNYTIRKVTPTGVVTTLARIYYPFGVAVDSAGNVYVTFVSILGPGLVKVTPAGEVTTPAVLVDAAGSAAQFTFPASVVVEPLGSILVADAGTNVIRKVTPAGAVTTVARLAGSSGVAVDSAGNFYLVDNSTIQKVTLAGVVTTLAGLAGNEGSADGTGSAARFSQPHGVALDSAGNVYVADTRNNTIRKITPEGIVTTLAGLAGNQGSADGTGSAARFNYPFALAVNSAGEVYVSDLGDLDSSPAPGTTIRKVTPGGVVTTLAGAGSGGAGSADGTRSAARFNHPYGVAVDSVGNVYVADSNNNAIRKVTPAGVVTTLAGNPTNPPFTGSGSSGLAVDSADNVYVADTGNNTIRKVTPAGVVTTLAGLAGNAGSADGRGSAARFSSPSGVAVDGAGIVYVADTGNFTIRKVTPAGVVTTLAGLAGNQGSTDGTGSDARFRATSGVAVDNAGNVYVADTSNYTIRKVTPAGMVTTLAGLAGNPGSVDGTASEARFRGPSGVAVDSGGNLYVVDSGNSTIRKVTPAGVVTTLAGVELNSGSADGTGSAARFYYPLGVAVDSAGNVYVADLYNNTIRKGIAASSIPAPMLMPPSLNAGQFGFGITGLPGLAVDIESSRDLSQWQVVGTYVLEGGTNFYVSPTPALGTQFYRSHAR